MVSCSDESGGLTVAPWLQPCHPSRDGDEHLSLWSESTEEQTLLCKIHTCSLGCWTLSPKALTLYHIFLFFLLLLLETLTYHVVLAPLPPRSVSRREGHPQANMDIGTSQGIPF